MSRGDGNIYRYDLLKLYHSQLMRTISKNSQLLLRKKLRKHVLRQNL